MACDPARHHQTTDIVRVKVRGFYPGQPNRFKTFWAKAMPQRKPGTRVFLKVNDQGEAPVSYNEKTNVETTTKEFFVVAESEVVEVKPAVYCLFYGELEVVGEA